MDANNIARQLDVLNINDTEPVFGHHFDYPESIIYEGNASVVKGEGHFGRGAVYFPDGGSNVRISNTLDTFWLNPLGNYELEAFVKLKTSILKRLFELRAQGYSFYGGHTFKYFSSAVTWSAAKTACEELGGHLATSTSAGKNTFIRSLSSTSIWLGATDEAEEGTWEWITGEEWDYTNWYETQPDNANSNQHYLRLASTSGSSFWYDYSATDTSGYVCEWDYDMLGENIFSVGGLALGIKPADTADTGVNYYFYGGHTFKYFSSAVTWSAAKTACEELGGHLATSTSQEKNTFLTTVTTNRAWLGGTDEAKEGSWKWITGEAWNYTNWYETEPDNEGGSQSYLEINFTTEGKWNDLGSTATYGYICEWDYDMRDSFTNYYVTLSSTDWGIDTTITTTLDAGTWYHCLLRISDGCATVFIDGNEVISAAITGTGSLSPSDIMLGGYYGYMDEFVIRHGANSGSPIIPTHAYGAEVITETVSGSAGNAPVSRVAWSCKNLPAGLTLSESGLLSGRPTTAGTYECDFSVATNWGTATKTVRIVVADSGV